MSIYHIIELFGCTIFVCPKKHWEQNGWNDSTYSVLTSKLNAFIYRKRQKTIIIFKYHRLILFSSFVFIFKVHFIVDRLSLVNNRAWILFFNNDTKIRFRYTYSYNIERKFVQLVLYMRKLQKELS